MRAVTAADRPPVRTSGWALALVMGAAAGLVACQEAANAPATAPSLPPAATRKAPARPFVVFAAKDLELSELGVPVEPPVAVGSRASSETVWSDTPDVVSVEPDGTLVAHQYGQARIISSSGGPQLEVRVRPAVPAARNPAAAANIGAEPVTVMPDRATIRPGEVMAFQAHTPRGPVPATWASSDDRTVAHLQDQIFQGLNAGRAQVCARAMGRRACSSVEVIP